jgi:predicted amidohydrolase YtcJ
VKKLCEQSLHGLRIHASRKTKKGSIEKNKYADFVILDKDIMQIPGEDLLKINVVATFVNGELVSGKIQ